MPTLAGHVCVVFLCTLWGALDGFGSCSQLWYTWSQTSHLPALARIAGSTASLALLQPGGMNMMRTRSWQRQLARQTRP